MRETDMDIIELIKDNYNSFTRLQKVVGDYILEKIDSVVFLSLDKLASEIGVSTTTVIRFARSIGFVGYSDMQEEIRRQVLNKKSLPNRLDIKEEALEEDKLAVQLFENEIYNIQQTLSRMNMKNMNKAIDLLSNAKNIYIFGLRGAFPLAYSMALTLGEIKKNVRLISGVGMGYPEEVLSIEKKDVCLVYAFPRYLRMAIDMASWLKARGVKIILITSQAYKKMEKFADVILPCSVEGYSFKSSMVSPMVLNNYIITAVARRHSGEAKEMLSLTEQWLNMSNFLSE